MILNFRKKKIYIYIHIPNFQKKRNIYMYIYKWSLQIIWFYKIHTFWLLILKNPYILVYTKSFNTEVDKRVFTIINPKPQLTKQPTYDRQLSMKNPNKQVNEISFISFQKKALFSVKNFYHNSLKNLLPNSIKH